jgi:acylglycerol lipase
MPMTEGAFEGVGGVTIFTRAWQPAGKPHGVVVISHGFSSDSGQYEWVAQQLASKGLAVYALDHRGRGDSEGERFFVEKFSDYTSDLATFIDMVKAREPALPVFLLGHRAGGVISCGYALEHQGELAGLICESSAYQVPAADIAVKKDFRLVTLPLLILHGTEDKATKRSGSRELYEKAGSTDKMLKLYEGHFHDLLADVGKQQVMADIQAWIDAHLGTAIPRGGRELRV